MCINIFWKIFVIKANVKHWLADYLFDRRVAREIMTRNNAVTRKTSNEINPNLISNKTNL